MSTDPIGPSPRSSPGAPAQPGPTGSARLRRFLRGPRLADRRGFGFLIAIFVLVIVVFAVAFYGFMATLRPLPTAPVQFAPAYMSGGNGTFNVSSVDNASWPWTGFTVNLTINNFGSAAVPLAPSGQSATFLIGSSTHKDHYHVVWLDEDHDGKVSVGDVFWVTGDDAGLPGLSYVSVSLSWNQGAWTAVEYFVTSSAIV